MAEKFAELVAEVRADNKQLRAGMKDAERIVSTSAKNIEMRFEAMARSTSQSMQNLTTGSETVGSGFVAVGSSLALFGGKAVIAGAVLNRVGVKMRIVGNTAASFGRVMGRVGAALATTAAAVVVITGLFIALGAALIWGRDPKNFQWITDWSVGVKEAEAATAKLVARLKEQEKQILAVRKASAAAITGIHEQISVETGALPAREARERELRRGGDPFAASRAEAEETLGTAQTFKAAAEAQAATNQALEQQLLIVLRLATATDFITDAEEKRLRIAIAIGEAAEDERRIRERIAQSIRDQERSLARQLLIAAGAATRSNFARSERIARFMDALDRKTKSGGGSGGGGTPGAFLGLSSALRFGGGRNIQIGGRDPALKVVNKLDELLIVDKLILAQARLSAEPTLGN